MNLTGRFNLPETVDIPADDYAPPWKRTQNVDPEPVPDYPASPVNHELKGDIARNPIDDLASLMRALTYGEMIELTKAIWKANGDQPITLERLPGIWHQWAKGNVDGGPLVH